MMLKCLGEDFASEFGGKAHVIGLLGPLPEHELELECMRRR
jgi:hypothetical protein